LRALHGGFFSLCFGACMYRNNNKLLIELTKITTVKTKTIDITKKAKKEKAS
jgi:hypothetical protein